MQPASGYQVQFELRMTNQADFVKKIDSVFRKGGDWADEIVRDVRWHLDTIPELTKKGTCYKHD